MKQIILVVVLVGLLGCKTYDVEYVNDHIWKYEGGDYEINDFIYFGDDLIINEKMEIISGDTCIVGRLITIKENRIIIESPTGNKKGVYYLHSSADKGEEEKEKEGYKL